MNLTHRIRWFLLRGGANAESGATDGIGDFEEVRRKHPVANPVCRAILQYGPALFTRRRRSGLHRDSAVAVDFEKSIVWIKWIDFLFHFLLIQNMGCAKFYPCIDEFSIIFKRFDPNVDIQEKHGGKNTPDQ